MSDFGVRALERADVVACAALHRCAFPTFFLSDLGLAFLREFYQAFVDDPDAIALVGVDHRGRIEGVIVGTVRPHVFFRRLLLRRWFVFTWASLSLALRKPRTVPRLIRAARYRGDAPLPVSGALLSSICVAPDSRAGLGRLLLARFVQVVQTRGEICAYLTTDADGNDRVNDFYRRAGWCLTGHFVTPEGRPMNCYTWQQNKSAPMGKENE